MHASTLFGPVIIVQGGIYNEAKQTLADIDLFDIELKRWLFAKFKIHRKKLFSKEKP